MREVVGVAIPEKDNLLHWHSERRACIRLKALRASTLTPDEPQGHPANKWPQIVNETSLALIGSASAQSAGRGLDVEAEALSITRLEGSRWRGGRLWSWNRDLRAWGVVDRGAVGGRAAAARTRRVERTGRGLEATGSHDGLRHTAPDTWATTLAKTSVKATSLGAHEVSKPSVTVASWSAERIEPMTIVAPHRGQYQAGRVEGVFDGRDARRRRLRASARRAVRHALAR